MTKTTSLSFPKLGVVALISLPLPCLSQTGSKDSHRGLKDYYESYFSIDAAIRPQSASGPEADLIVKHFEVSRLKTLMKIGSYSSGRKPILLERGERHS